MLGSAWDTVENGAAVIKDILDVENGWFWLVLGLVGIILEALSIALVFASMGLAAILTGVISFLGVHSFACLLGIFIVLSMAIFFASRPLAAKLPFGKSTETNIHALIGRPGVVTEPIGGSDKPGRVKLSTEEWRALPADDQSFQTGTRVMVKRIEGSTAYVVREPQPVQTKEE